jgi:4-amino-4-deoxy-L-arabinose transferase-like glycosyltransferase
MTEGSLPSRGLESESPLQDGGSRPTAMGARFGLWVLAVGLAYAGQISLTSLDRHSAGAGLYAAALALFLFTAPRPSESEISQRVARGLVGTLPLSGRRKWAIAILGSASPLAAAASVACLAADHANQAAFVLWVVALATSFAAASLASSRASVTISGSRRGAATWLPLVGILALATVLRVPRLADIPADVHGDEGACGIEARLVLHNGDRINVFGAGWAGLPHLGYGISAPFMAIFGDDLYGLRTASAFLGIASILLTFLLARRLFSARVATLAAFLLASSAWHIHFSRTGFHYMQATFATVLLFYLVERALATTSPRDFLLAGFAAALCWIVYFGARLSPLIAALYVCHRAFRDRGLLKRSLPGLAIAAGAASLFLVPFVASIVQGPPVLLARTERVWVFGPNQMRHELQALRVDSASAVVGKQIVSALSAFNVRGDTSVQYGHRGPLLDFWTAAFFVLGVGYATAHIGDPRCFLLATWFWPTLVLGGMLTVDALSSHRVIALMPAVFLCSAIAIDAGWQAASRWAGEGGLRSFAIVVSGFLLLALQANARDYFLVHAPEVKAAGFHTLLARYIAPLRRTHRIYFFGGGSTFIRYDTERFLVPGAETIDVRGSHLRLPLPAPADGKGIAFVIDAAARDGEMDLDAIRRAYPKGREEIVRRRDETIAFRCYLVGRDLLDAVP